MLLLRIYRRPEARADRKEPVTGIASDLMESGPKHSAARRAQHLGYWETVV